MSVNREPREPINNNRGREEPSGSSGDSQKVFENLENQKNSLQKLSLTDGHLPELMRLRNDAQELQRRLPSASKTPSRAGISQIIEFVEGAIDVIKRDSRNQKEQQRAKKDPPKDLSTVDSSFFRGDSPFSASAIRRSNALGIGGDNSDQNRILKELKDFVEKTTDGINERLDRLDTNVNSRLDRLGTELNGVTSRLGHLESYNTLRGTSQSRFEESLSSLTRTVERTQDHFSNLDRKVDLISQRQQQQQQSAAPAGPLLVNVNLTGFPSGLTLSSTPISVPVSAENSIGQPTGTTMSQKAVLSTVTPAQQQQSSPVPSVNVPRGPQTLQEAPVRSAQGVMSHEVTGSATVAWGNPPMTKAAPAPPKPSSVAPPASAENVKLETKPNLFSGFSGFGNKAASTGGPFSTGMFSSPGEGNDFAGLAKASPVGAGFHKTDKPFPGAGAVLFGGAQPATGSSSKQEDAEEEEEEEAYEPQVEFKALVSLPVVEVRTGEEDFDKIFSDRAKLFRLDKALGEWKERGLGDMTIQRMNNPPAGKVVVRLLMRWEKTLKICANHHITPTMKLLPMNQTDQKSWKWLANDFSDEVLKLEHLAIRFKTKEQADKFKSAFESAQSQILAAATPEAPPAPLAPTQKLEILKETPPGDSNLSWGDKFKPQQGVWTCPGCYTANSPLQDVCPCCNTAKPGSVPAASSTGSQPFGLGSTGSTASAATFGFGYQSGVKTSTPAPLFGFAGLAAVPSSTTSAPTFGFGSQVTLPSSTLPNSSFSFGSLTETEADLKLVNKSESTPAPFAGFGLGFPSTGPPAFGLSTPLKTQAAVAPAPFTLASPSAGGFSFSLGTTQEKAPASNKKDDSSGDEDNDVEAERNDLYFKPVVKLPDNVDILTGEENEIELYSQRAKLYRFADGEWKERGIGDLKMMKECSGNKIRLLMRREKILKVCCNHLVGPGIDLIPMPKTKNAWIWNAQDFSEGSILHEKFAVKFKYEAHWQEFKELVERCKRIAASQESAEGLDKFDRVEISEAEATVPIAESGKKAIEAMAVNNPFGTDSPFRVGAPRVEEPPTSPAVQPASDVTVEEHGEEGSQETPWGDKTYRFFGVIYNGRQEAVAIGVPSLGFCRLKSPKDLETLIAADAVSEDLLRNEVHRLTEKIDINGENMPEGVRRYVRAMKIKEIGDDESWKMVLFERQLTLLKKDLQGGAAKSLGPGLLHIIRDGDFDSPYLLQLFSLSEKEEDYEELAVHTVVHDCNFEVDRQRLTAQWTANDYAVSEKAQCAIFQVKFSNKPALSEFEAVFLDGISVAQESDVSLRSTV